MQVNLFITSYYHRFLKLIAFSSSVFLDLCKTDIVFSLNASYNLHEKNFKDRRVNISEAQSVQWGVPCKDNAPLREKLKDPLGLEKCVVEVWTSGMGLVQHPDETSINQAKREWGLQEKCC